MYLFFTTYDPGGPHGEETLLTVLPPLTHSEGEGWRREKAVEEVGSLTLPSSPS